MSVRYRAIRLIAIVAGDFPYIQLETALCRCVLAQRVIKRVAFDGFEAGVCR